MDWMGSKKKDSVSEHCDVVARKMGHNPIPLVCVLFKVKQLYILSPPSVERGLQIRFDRSLKGVGPIEGVKEFFLPCLL